MAAQCPTGREEPHLRDTLATAWPLFPFPLSKSAHNINLTVIKSLTASFLLRSQSGWYTALWESPLSGRNLTQLKTMKTKSHSRCTITVHLIKQTFTSIDVWRLLQCFTIVLIQALYTNGQHNYQITNYNNTQHNAIKQNPENVSCFNPEKKKKGFIYSLFTWTINL